jgi:hypothetical protein
MGHQQTTPDIDVPSAHCQTATQGVAEQLFSAMGIERLHYAESSAEARDRRLGSDGDVLGVILR